MGNYIIILVIIVIVALLVLGVVIVVSLNAIYLFLLNVINRIKRIFWSKTLVNLSYKELKDMLNESKISLERLKSDDNKLSAGLDAKGREIENFFLMFKIDAIEAEINDTKAKIDILMKLTPQQQTIENLTPDRQISQLQRELESFALTSDYKLVERFVSKNLDKGNDDNLPKLQLLLESKGWNGTTDELQDLITKESRKQHLDNAKSRILSNKCESREEILKSYLNYYQPNGIELLALEEILRERNLSATNSATLQSDLDNLISKIEMEQFEKSLTDGGR